MGVVHKLKPEVLNFILENKQNNPALSCRHLTSLIFEQLHIKVSKSSINAVFKENALSMPIGRRRKEKKKKFKMPVLPVIEETETTRLGSLPQDIAQNLEKEKLAEDKAAREAEKAKAAQDAIVKEQERLEQEAAENKRKEEIRRLEEEIIAKDIEDKNKLEEARKLEEERIAQEEARLKEQERLGQEAAENKRKLEEARKLEEERIAQEEVRLRELEKAAKEAEEKRRVEDEARRLAEEKAAQEVAHLKSLEEARVKDLERLAQAAAEARRLEEERAAQELKAEREKWAKLAEEEKQKSSQQADKREETVPPPQAEPVTAEILPQDRLCSGAMMLKALDNLIGGSKEINALISRATGTAPADSLRLTEAMIFKSLFTKDIYTTLGDLIGVRYPQEKINNYYAQVKQLPDIGVDTAKTIANVFAEAKGMKLHFTDGSLIHLDGQLYSSWPGTRFPYDFSNITAELKNYLNRYFLQGAPLVLFSPPGYDIFPKDFFTLLLNFASKDNRPDSLTLFGNQLEELDTLPVNQQSAYSLIFGLWPWQFTTSRKVRKIGDFNLKYIKEIDRDLYLGEIQIDLFRASLNQSITLKGCAVKTDLKEKIRLVILNSAETAMGLDELAGFYLSRWPNFEEAFQDFTRKIELFTYTGAEQGFFPKDSFNMDTAGVNLEMAGILAGYVKMLDAYLRWHFLPTEYREKDLSTTSDCFYKIPAKLISGENRMKVKTLVSQDYQFLKDLEYLNCRLNERQINSPGGQRIWFESAFK